MLRSRFFSGLINFVIQVRRAIKGFIGDNPEYERLLPHVKGNVGFSLNSVNSCLLNVRQRRIRLHER